MTRRFWYFSLIAFVGAVAVAITLAVSYERLNVTNLTELSADKNVSLAHSLSNAAREPFVDLLQESTGLNLLGLRALAASSGLAETLAGQVRDLGVLKVNLFDLNSVAIFSTDPTLIGIRIPGNPGIVSALDGRVISDIIRENTRNSFDQVAESRDLIQTYIPFFDDEGMVVGVFEVYSDITPLLTRIDDTRLRIVLLVGGLLALLYALLVWLYGRIDQRLVREQAATQLHLEQIETAKDTLELRVAERTRDLEKSRSFLQTAMDGVPDPAIVIDAKYHVTSMNSAARDSLNVAHKKGAPIFCYRAMHGLDSPCDGDVSCTLKTGAPCNRTESRERADGEYQQVEFRTTPLRGPDGKITGAIEIAHDLNEREQAEFRLRQEKERAETASRVKSEFVATMSHEIRTPMNAVLGMTDLLQLTNLTRKQQGYIQTIQSSGNMLLSLVDNILDFTRMGAGALLIRNREFRVSELLENVLEVMGNHAYSKGLELVGVLDTDTQLRVSGDENRLRQILVNLVGNAVKFSDDGEVIVRIGTESRHDGRQNLRFSVSDSGIGMSAEAKAMVFTPFASIDERAGGRHQGSGLGLSICKQLIEQMGGEIGVDSKLAEGTRIWFAVPVEQKPPQSNHEEQDQRRLRGKRILTVHRSSIIDQVICSYAKAWGMCCDAAADDDVALERLRAAEKKGQPYAAVIIDIAPHDTGRLAFVRRIRSIEEFSKLPVMMLTPISMSMSPGSISSIGQVRCINKPLLPSELLQTLCRLLDREKPPVAENLHVQDKAANAQLRILVAEDNPVNRQVMIGMLESLGYIADFVEDGAAAIELLSQRPYDLVLMDCQMPDMDGEQVSEEIRKDTRRFPNQPIIVAVTADASLEHQSACLAAGMDDFIAKPVRLGKLGRGLQKWKSMLVAKGNNAERNGGEVRSADSDEIIAHLHERTGSKDEQFLSNYIDLFLEDTAGRIQKLAEAMEEHDAARLRRESHSLKGACLEFGATRMGRYCDDVSAAAAREALSDVPYQLQKLRREFERIRPVFEAEKNACASQS